LVKEVNAVKKLAWWVGICALALVLTGFTVKDKDGSNFPDFSLTFTQGTVGTTAVAFARECLRITIKAHAANSGNIYIGDSGVTADKGFELDGGEELTIDSYTFNEVYLIGSVAAQKYSYVCYN
jgi:hypothetical protein